MARNKQGKHNPHGKVLHVETTLEHLSLWRSKASQSGMTLKAWVEYALDDAPIIVQKDAAK